MNQRKYFGTDGVRGKVGGPLINAEFALRLGYATGRVFVQHKKAVRERPTVLIGKDTRISGYMLESALEAGLSAAGVDVLLAGPIPTPAVAYLTRALRLVAGIVISASHNPYYDNGIKFFSGNGMKLPDEIELAIEEALEQPIGCVPSKDLGRASRVGDSAGRYIEFCKSTFPNEFDLSGFKLVVDAANGAAYDIAGPVFTELGGDVVAVACQPDGFNINDNCGALHPEHLAEHVKKHDADLGIALDGDADRLIMADRDGRIYNGDQLLYAIVCDRLAQGQVDGVVGTLMTNLGLERKMQALGIPFERSAVGDRYVLELLQQRKWLLGGESSGHLLCLDCHTTGDGIVAALQVLAALIRSKKSLAELVNNLTLYPQKLVNVDITPEINWQSHEGLAKATQKAEQTLDGRGRVLIRASGTEPKLRLMIEAETPELAEQSMAHLLAVDLTKR